MEIEGLKDRVAKLEAVLLADKQPAEKRYRDVTAECHISDHPSILPGSVFHSRAGLIMTPTVGYRLRKVPYDTIRIKRTDERPEDCITPGSAFIIEHEEPERTDLP